jgi:hypothetical protein
VIGASAVPLMSWWLHADAGSISIAPRTSPAVATPAAERCRVIDPILSNPIATSEV